MIRLTQNADAGQHSAPARRKAAGRHMATGDDDMGRRLLGSATGVALASAVTAACIIVATTRADRTRTPPVTTVTTGTAPVTRVDIAERRQVNGILGFAGSYDMIAPAPGRLTQLPAIGAVVSRGQVAYETDGKPVVLMYGSRPAWRAFERGMADGADVEQLESNLKELGYGNGLTVDQHFANATYLAVRRWQQAAAQPVTGSVPLGQIVFVPKAVRISSHVLQLGSLVEPGTVVQQTTSDQPAITIQLSPQQLPTAKVDDRVVVTLPDGTTRGGRIAEIGAVATPAAEANANPGNGSNPGESTVPVTVQADGAVNGFVDQATVRVAITVALHRNVLAVPIVALNSVPGGAYEVIVVDGTTTRRIAVQTGLFDEFAGLAEVSGPGLAEGQQVQVPRDHI
jgi:peptidoglycan hydrolase-like protein with peptidoglycan-binding domain